MAGEVPSWGGGQTFDLKHKLKIYQNICNKDLEMCRCGGTSGFNTLHALATTTIVCAFKHDLEQRAFLSLSLPNFLYKMKPVNSYFKDRAINANSI